MDNPPQNLGELRQAMQNEWAEIPVERLQYLLPTYLPVANMPQRLAAIINSRGKNTQYWAYIHNTTPTGSIMQKIKFVWPDLLQLPFNDI